VSFLFAAPQYLASAATDLAGIGSVISEANTFAAGGTLGVLPAGADEVSALMAALFEAHGQAYQALSAQAALFHDQFVQVLNGAGSAYAAAEADAVQTLASAVSAPAQGLSAAAGSPLQRLEQAETAFNRGVANSGIALVPSVFVTNSALNGVINRGVNFGNLLGAQTPAGFTAGLLTGSSAQVVNGGQSGGLAGAAVDSAPAQPLPSVVPAPVPALASSPSGLLQQISQAQTPVNANAASGRLSVISGTGELTADCVLGARVPAEQTASLRAGASAPPFNAEITGR
jgi:hypothetical protein